MRSYCDIAESRCLNPAGYGTQMGIADNSDGPRTQWVCPECGAIACRHCRTKFGKRMLCLYCAEKAQETQAMGKGKA